MKKFNGVDVVKTSFVFCLMSLVLVASASAEAPKQLKPWDEVGELERTLDKEKKPFRERAMEMRKLLAEPRIATNSSANVRAQKAIANWCLMRGWIQNWYYDYDLIKELYPEMMPKILSSSFYNDIDKLWFVENYVKYFAVTEKYDDGVAMVLDQLGKLKFRNPKDLARLKIALAEMYRYADRFDAAVAAARDAMADDPDAGALEGARIASDWQREDLVKEFVLKMSAPVAAKYVCPYEQNRWQRVAPDWAAKHLSDFVLDASKPAADRLATFAIAFSRDLSPLGERMLAAMMALPAAEVEKANYRADFTFVVAYACGSWARAAKLYELALRTKANAKMAAAPCNRRIYLLSLFAGGRKDEAIAKAAEFAADEQVAAQDRAVYLGYGALFTDRGIEPALTGLATSKEKSEVVRDIGRAAMAVGRTDVAERLEKTYAAFFAPRKVREMNVAFTDEPIRSISDWRRIYPTLEKGPCDIPFGEGLNLADLVSDVNTKREINGKGEGDSVDVRMEMTCVADRYALHLFLRTPDPRARDVEHGFVNGITTEMYFAPGLEEPYQCIGSNPLTGVNFVMNTLYDSAANTRLKLEKDGGLLRSEVAFTDSDYVLHLTLPWQAFYQKLPKAGSKWKFDCIAWAPDGPMTWGGSRGIHHSSDWGHLVFNLKPRESAAIKRELILANYRTWSTPAPTGNYRTLDVFEKWTEDRVGDRAFHDACLKDWAKELKDLQAKVSPQMDDATVEEVYEKGLVRWLGVKHEIDARRKAYLADKLLKETGSVRAAKLPQDPRPSERYAAEEYAAWTAKLTGAKAPELEIVRDDALGEDGFRLRNAGGRLVVSGGRRGVLYGVYEALERFGGIEWLSIGTTVVPENGALRLPEGLDEVQKPAFELRQPLWYDVMHSPDLAARLKLNSSQLQERHGGCSHLFDTKLRNCHTFEWLVPQEKYFKDHPEYYSEWEGKRRDGRTQLCLTNPDVLKIVTGKVLERIAANPEAKYFGVSQNDWGFYCTCTNCAAVDAEEESHAGTLIRFVNAVAEEVGKKYPDKVIETLAYQYTRKPPKKTRVRKNVMPCLCSIECEFKNPLAKSDYPANKSFLEDLRGWAAQTDQLYVWDYTTDFADYLYPFPNVHALQENIRTFRANKVKSLFEQGAYQGRHADFAELKTWLIAKWMWNPDQPEEELLQRFFAGYYGAAAKVVRQYFDEFHALPRKGEAGNPLSIYESAYSPSMPDAFLERAAGLWDEAERLVKDDPVRSYNVRMGRLSVDTTRLLRHCDAAKRWSEYRALAKRVLAAFDEAKDIRFSETRKYDEETLSDWRKIVACATFEEAARDLSVDTFGKRDPCLAIDRLFFETGKTYTLRVHVRGGGFEAGVDDWDSVLNHGKRKVESKDVKDGWAWYDVLTWQTRKGEYFWFRPLDKATEIDRVELVLVP